jgi:ketosteroid isomerase-like protein
MKLRSSNLCFLASALLLAPILCRASAAWTQAPTQQTAHAPDPLRALSREELDVVKVLTRQEDAWNRGDLDAFATGYKKSPDLLFVGRQVSRGFDDVIADYKHNYPNKDSMGTLSFSDIEPHVLDEHFAYVIGRYKVERSKKAGGNAEGIFSLIFEKTPDGWKIIVDHTTS